MKRTLKTAINSMPKTTNLVWNKEKRDYDETVVPYTVIEREDGTVVLTDEEGIFCTHPLDLCEVIKPLREWANKHGFIWECEYPGTFTLHKK